MSLVSFDLLFLNIVNGRVEESIVSFQLVPDLFHLSVCLSDTLFMEFLLLLQLTKFVSKFHLIVFRFFRLEGSRRDIPVSSLCTKCRTLILLRFLNLNWLLDCLVRYLREGNLLLLLEFVGSIL